MNTRSTIATWVRTIFVASFAVIAVFALVSPSARAQELRDSRIATITTDLAAGSRMSCSFTAPGQTVRAGQK